MGDIDSDDDDGNDTVIVNNNNHGDEGEYYFDENTIYCYWISHDDNCSMSAGKLWSDLG